MSRPAPHVYDRIRDLVAIPEFRAYPSSRPSSTINEVFTGEPLAEIPAGTADDVVAAVERAPPRWRGPTATSPTASP